MKEQITKFKERANEKLLFEKMSSTIIDDFIFVTQHIISNTHIPNENALIDTLVEYEMDYINNKIIFTIHHYDKNRKVLVNDVVIG